MTHKVKAIFTVLIILIMCFVFAGCSSCPIEGEWQLSKLQFGETTYTIEEFLQATNSNAGSDEIKIQISIDNEGKFTLYRDSVEVDDSSSVELKMIFVRI